MSRSIRSHIPGSSAAAVLLAGLLVPATPAAAASPSYVALGDSYSSGVGTRSYIDDGTSCQRSMHAFPSLIAAGRGYALNLRACSGAKIPDVTNAQLGALSSTTSYVSISVGGNDAGFSSVLTECAKPAWMSNCNAAIDKAWAYIDSTLPGALRTLYSAIRSRATRAKVVVVGYPRIFNGEDCNAGTWFSPTEQTRLNQTADRLNAKLATAASGAGFTMANPTSAFTGHAVCADVEWINGLSNPVSESYHPNRAGHSSGYTPLVSPKLTGVTLRVSSATTRTARASAEEQARLQRTYAARDAGIRPQRVLAPDLDSRQARRAARRAGVDLADRRSIDAADRRHSRQQARAWSAGRSRRAER